MLGKSSIWGNIINVWSVISGVRDPRRRMLRLRRLQEIHFLAVGRLRTRPNQTNAHSGWPRVRRRRHLARLLAPLDRFSSIRTTLPKLFMTTNLPDPPQKVFQYSLFLTSVCVRRHSYQLLKKGPFIYLYTYLYFLTRFWYLYVELFRRRLSFFFFLLNPSTFFKRMADLGVSEAKRKKNPTFGWT